MGNKFFKTIKKISKKTNLNILIWPINFEQANKISLNYEVLDSFVDYLNKYFNKEMFVQASTY